MLGLNDLYLAVDLDGTLLNSNGELSQETIEFLNKWPGTVIFVTGRNKGDTQKITSQLRPQVKEIYAVFNDGSHISKLKEGEFTIIREFDCIEQCFFDKFSKWIKGFKSSWVIYKTGETISVVNDRGLLGTAAVKLLSHGSKIINQKQVQNIDKSGIIKIAINSFKSISREELFKKFQEQFGQEVYAVKNDGMIEIKHTNATKLKALLFMMENIGFDSESVLYFGNGGNDVPCLSYFPHSFAVENATDDAKNAAKEIITSNDNDGVVNKLKSIKEDITCLFN